MALVTGAALQARFFFSKGSPGKRGSSFDLTIGTIIDPSGRHVEQYLLNPGEITSVVSEEIFSLPNTVTGHVTYKTTLTRRGVWALTVGIVDAGWQCPITTTLLNFSSEPFLVQNGVRFLRVSLFEHAEVEPISGPTVEEYMREARELAVKFPRTFLDQHKIADISKEAALAELQRAATFAATLLGVLLAAAALFVGAVALANDIWGKDDPPPTASPQHLEELTAELRLLRLEIDELRVRVARQARPDVADETATQPAASASGNSQVAN